ncbi:cyclic nucleotide-binding domain-containing protein [Streptomyces platensis]|uniref:cyclic nucleotide-binding domain-containing protein n=1 Tax=Streptomyces platensis TaxID=58346 RepID=UPI002E80F6E8|nr:cyclic nucleotide-binding domain-containing protein [Streptomyces platensis]WTI50539.1 cyclic nucleotide-binding domain-containing protein [Streptomyces platensis]WUB83907.1 cyclic nucleotide-binding domain-containing protein [Streptomyces platensis]
MIENMLGELPPDRRRQLTDIAVEVSLPRATRLFEEGRRADRFWIIRSGQVVLDQRVPGRRAAVVETLGRGELLGWAWMFPPYLWHLGAETVGPVDAVEFDARAVRELCESDPVLGRGMYCYVAKTVADRLHGTRTRLLDLYGPQGSGLDP